MQMTKDRPLVSGMAARVRRMPARSKVDPATTSPRHLQWWRDQAAQEAQHVPVPQDGAGHALYRFYNADDVLLYIGITTNLPKRFRGHGDTKPWWSDVARTAVEHFSNHFDALAAEKMAIINERPLYNCTHSRRRQ
jgi:predicted GIY-YIG superfamily endonuclease